MYLFLIVTHVTACLVLVCVILLQAGKGGGLSETFGAGSTSTIFGTSASTFLKKATAVCAALFLITSLSLTILSSHRAKSIMRLERLKEVMPDVEKPSIPMPGMTVVPQETKEEKEIPLEKEAAPQE